MTPVDWAAVSAAITGCATVVVKWLIPGIVNLKTPHANGSTKALEARMAGGEAATMLAEVRENRRGVDAANGGIDSVHAIVTGLAKTTERSSQLLEQVTHLVSRSDERWQALTESTEAMSRMLQLHTGILDRVVYQVDKLADPPNKRGKK